MQKMYRGRITLPFATLILLASCSQPLTTREKGALAGGGLGAAAGAAIGAATGSPGAGAAIGGALGAVGGGLVGGQMQQQEEVTKEQQRVLEQQQQELTRNRQLLEELKRKNLEARETERGVVVNLPDVLFAFGRADLTHAAVVKARSIAEVLTTQATGRRISVEGHTDAIGSEAFNQQLSERRAETVASALEGAGVNPHQIMARGFSERYPVAPNTNPDGTDNPAGRARNRRVEVVIEN
ncbi:MAG TPA: OmpA family protein [Candidatus Binatia bacterium]|nr:OmpA family protein [Candidatus Binatia bacterium]